MRLLDIAYPAHGLRLAPKITLTIELLPRSQSPLPPQRTSQTNLTLNATPAQALGQQGRK